MIFEDPSRRRWRKAVWALYVAICVSTLLFVNVVAWFLLNLSEPDTGALEKELAKNLNATAKRPGQPDFGTAQKRSVAMNQKWPNPSELTKRISKLRKLPPIRERFPGGEMVSGKAEWDTQDEKEAVRAPLPDKPFVQVAFQEERVGFVQGQPVPAPAPNERPFLHAWFLKQSDVPYAEAVAPYVSQLDVVFPDWFWLGDSDCSVSETIDWRLYDLMQKDPVTLPMFSDDGDTGRFAAIIRDKGKSKCLINELRHSVEKRSVPGIDLDIANLQPQDRDFYTAWLLSVTESFHDEGLYVAVNVPMDDSSFDYSRIWQIADIVVIRGFDEHSAAGKPGSLAGSKWFPSRLDKIKEQLAGEKRAKIVVTLGSYAYDWNTTSKTAPETMGFYAAMSLAKSVWADVRMDRETRNETFSYVDANGERHEVWLQDATNVWNERLQAKQAGTYGVALYRIWLEDASVWKFFSSKSQWFDPTDLSDLPNSEYPVSTGIWKAFRIVKIPTAGFRSLSVSGSVIETAKYETLPQNLEVERYGMSGSGKTVALTFDDDPDPEYMNELMDVLKKYGVHATFFFVQKDPSDRSNLLRRAYAEGHMIAGIAPAESATPQDMLQFSLAVGSATGHRPLLFKTTDDPEKNLAIGKMSGSGYLFIPADIDSGGVENPNPESLLSTVESRAKNDPSGTAAIHFSSGNKDEVLASLDSVIPVLLKKGYRFVAANELLGISRGAVMPEMAFMERYMAFWRNFFSSLSETVIQAIGMIFAVATVLCVFRIAFLGAFVVRSFKLEHYPTPNDFHPPATVLVPAYNEEKVIERTILWLLRSDYPEFEILVIDDGSKDQTAARVAELSKQYPNVRLITKKNEGKSLALNLGFQEAKYDYIITVDADTIVLNDTLTRLMEPFASKDVDAVCGNISVGNVKNILTAFQEIEYVTGQNFDKRAFDALNCISVVPGATGAWKKQKVIEIGGYESDTLVEDADLTLTLLERGGRVVFAPMAKSITEAPETVHALYKQRFRWSYGTFQCFWKHRGTFGKGPLGIIALPNMIFSQVVFNIMSPVGDAVFLYAILSGTHLESIAFWYGIFFLSEAVVTVAAYALDRKSFKYIWVILIQRFFYRQFMYTVTFASLLAAVRGSRHGWNKLERKGTVQLVDGPAQKTPGLENLGVQKSF